MRILLLTQYYHPEGLFKGLIYAKELVRQGHEVEVLTGFPNYPGGKVYPGYRVRFLQREVIEGVPVVRVPLYPSHEASLLPRMANYLSFGFAASLIGTWAIRKPDVVYAYHGHATVAMPACMIKWFRGAPFVMDIQDIWPDSIVSSGMLPGWCRPLVPVLAAWSRFTYRQAKRIAVLSKGFKETLAARGVPPEKIAVIPNWCDPVSVLPGPVDPEEARLLDGRFNVVMAGNMGKMQALDVVLEAAAALRDRAPRLQFVLVGGGVDRARLESRAREEGLTNVLFLPRRPVDKIGALLNRAEALLVHLKDDPLFAVTIPSRIQAYLAVGRPILCGLRGNGAEMVEEAGAGICFRPDDAASLVESVEALLAMPAEDLRALGERGRTYYDERLSLPVGTKAFIEQFELALHS